MRNMILSIVLFLSLSCLAASYSWRSVGIYPDGVWEPTIKGYGFWGQIYGDNPYVSIGGTEGTFVGYKDEEGYHLKQGDYSSTEMPRKNNVWVLAVYGDILSHDTIWNAQWIELSNIYDYTMTGGTLIETPEDFYLGFMAHGYRELSDTNWFGWMHLSVNENLEMSLLDAGIGLNGEAIRIGIGAIPEPASGFLLLLGLGVFGLRRRWRMENVTMKT